MWAKLVEGLGYPEDSIPNVLTEYYWTGGGVTHDCDWMINQHEWPELFDISGPELIFMEAPAHNAKDNTARIVWLLKKSI